jgi:hypothetical protein
MVMFSISVLLFCFSLEPVNKDLRRRSVGDGGCPDLVVHQKLLGVGVQGRQDQQQPAIIFCSCAGPHPRCAQFFFALILRRGSSPSLPYGHSGNLQVIPDRERVDV